MTGSQADQDPLAASATGTSYWVEGQGATQPPKTHSVAFSQDGRWLAAGRQDGSVWLYEMSTGLCALSFTTEMAGPLAFQSDSRILAAAQGRSVVVWDLSDLSAGGGAARNAQGESLLEKLFQETAAGDTRKAYAAMHSLAHQGDLAVRFVGNRIPAVASNSPADIQEHVRQLSGEDQGGIDAAIAEIKEHVDASEPLLREIVLGSSRNAARVRARSLLREFHLSSLAFPNARIQALRGIQVLEWVGTRKARAALKTLAEGHPRSPRTAQARSAIKRLERGR